MPNLRPWLLFPCFLFLAGCGAVWLNEGAKTASLTVGLEDPNAGPKVRVKVPPEGRVIMDFNDGSNKANPKLYGGGGGDWMSLSYAGNENNINKDFIVEGGVNGTPMAAHIFGTLVDKGNASYPSFAIQGRFTESGNYNAENFAGIQFHYKCPSEDQALKRRFAIATVPTLPKSDGGSCVSGCYNHFGLDLTPTGGEWKLVSSDFVDIKRESGWGSAVTPPDLVDHLKEFVNLQWQHGANNAAGGYKIDYWVDEVEFY
jgi:hypothetical protein